MDWQQRYVLRYDLAEVETDFVARVLVSNLPPRGPRRSVDVLPDVGQILIDRPRVNQAVAAYVERVKRGKWRDVDPVTDLLEAEHDETAAKKLRRCHDPNSGWLEFCPTDPDHHMKYRPERCWLRICPHCAKAIAQRLRNRYEDRISKVMAATVPGWSLKHLTLTMRRDGDLAAQISVIHQATKKLIRHFWTSKDKRAGAFATFEIGPKGGNVHVHCIVYGRYVPKQEVSDHWRKLTDNYVVDIGRIDPNRAVAEGIKYVTKFAKNDGDEGRVAWVLSAPDLAALHFALKGKRRAWSWGAFYGIGDEDAETGEGEEAATDVCPKCGAPLAMATMRAVQHLLDLKSVNKCRVEEASTPPLLHFF